MGALGIALPVLVLDSHGPHLYTALWVNVTTSTDCSDNNNNNSTSIYLLLILQTPQPNTACQSTTVYLFTSTT
ncbi:hypothetical protein E2C01_019643 [Portunus trituberculatus]|uniref:Uncharacterized protein n=1 Tax=Portunus trituberculatus TaxID=210409 RepID=A0A5B7DXT3_PORTR|nr:hypothetical protein [Portunus trituberculatus]